METCDRTVGGADGGNNVTDFRLLGPVETIVDGRALPPGRPRQQLVLAILLVDAGRPVPPETLIDRVWGEAPPPSARRSLHVYIARIRRILASASAAGGAGNPPRVVRSAGGYLMSVPVDRVDVHRFRSLVDRARDGDPASGEDAGALGLLRAAVELWQGEPLAGLPGQWAARTRLTWWQQYQDAVVSWAHAEIEAGNASAALPRLSALADDNPLVEPLAAALIRALHAAGRSAEALARFATTRRRLVDELGVEPGPELRETHRFVLRGESDVLPARPGGPAAPTPPAQLPADVTGFAGRDDALSVLDAWLREAPGRAATAVLIAVLSGMAGVGKTTLAVHWAHRVPHQFPDGQLYVNLHGFDVGRAVSTAEAVHRFLLALGVPPSRIPPDLDAQSALYRSLLAGKRILVLLDNARDEDQIRPLLPGSPTAAAVVTSRHQLPALVAAEGARSLMLDVLPPVEARELLARRLGADRVTDEPDAADRIVAACAGLPLALAIAASRAQQTGFQLSAVAAELGGAGRRLDALEAGHPTADVRTVFSWSYTALSPSAGRLFRLLGLTPGADISAAAAASLAGRPAAETRRLLTTLVRGSLLAEHLPGRYAFHDLLRAYARDLAATVDSDADQLAATTRLIDHYVHTAHTAERLLSPSQNPITVPLNRPAPGVHPESLVDDGEAMRWLAAEQHVLVSVLRHALDTGRNARAWQLAWSMDTFLIRQGRWRLLVGMWQAALRASERLSDPSAEARAHCLLAYALTLVGDFAAALDHHTRALDIYTRVEDRRAEANTHHNLAIVWARQGHLDTALRHAGRARALHCANDNPVGQAHSLNAIGWYHARLGDHARAVDNCRRALELFQRSDDCYGEAATWDSLGYAYHHAGRHERAADCYGEAVALFRRLQYRYNEAVALTHLGEADAARGRADAARTAWEDALEIFVDLDRPDADDVRSMLTGLAARAATARPGS